MTSIARTVLNKNSHDNMTLDRLVARSGYQDCFPEQVDHNFNKEQTAYIFTDGSALINCNDKWHVKSNYGFHADNLRY